MFLLPGLSVKLRLNEEEKLSDEVWTAGNMNMLVRGTDRDSIVKIDGAISVHRRCRAGTFFSCCLDGLLKIPYKSTSRNELFLSNITSPVSMSNLYALFTMPRHSEQNLCLLKYVSRVDLMEEKGSSTTSSLHLSTIPYQVSIQLNMLTVFLDPLVWKPHLELFLLPFPMSPRS